MSLLENKTVISYDDLALAWASEVIMKLFITESDRDGVEYVDGIRANLGQMFEPRTVPVTKFIQKERTGFAYNLAQVIECCKTSDAKQRLQQIENDMRKGTSFTDIYKKRLRHLRELINEKYQE